MKFPERLVKAIRFADVVFGCVLFIFLFVMQRDMLSDLRHDPKYFGWQFAIASLIACLAGLVLIATTYTLMKRLKKAGRAMTHQQWEGKSAR